MASDWPPGSSAPGSSPISIPPMAVSTAAPPRTSMPKSASSAGPAPCPTWSIARSAMSPRIKSGDGLAHSSAKRSPKLRASNL
jgi:hypothetical protein